MRIRNYFDRGATSANPLPHGDFARATGARTAEEIEQEIVAASAADVTDAEFYMLKEFVFRSNADRLFSIGIAELARNLDLSDLKNVRRVRDNLIAKGAIEIIHQRPAKPPIYRLAYALGPTVEHPIARAARTIVAKPTATTLPLPLFLTIARACAREGARVVINHDSGKATVTPPGCEGAFNG